VNTLLMIMNPRAIPECIDAFRLLRGIDKAWMSYYTEAELVPVIADLIANTDYHRYLLCSDDTIPTQTALDAILTLHDKHPEAVTTGWVNIDSECGLSTINPAPLAGTRPSRSAYSFLPIEDVPPGQIRTYFHGYALTCMSRELWQRYPYNVFNPLDGGCASDYHQCLQLQAADIPIYTNPDCRFEHVKEIRDTRDQGAGKQLLLGHRAPVTTLEYTWQTGTAQ